MTKSTVGVNDMVLIDEQSDFIIVTKPTGISFHDEDILGSGLFSQIKAHYGYSELYPVHRLDKITSGLMIFAKNKIAATAFQQLFEQHKIQKYYLALSDKKPNKKQGLIKGDMVKSRRSMWKLLRSQTNPAISQFFSYSIDDGKRLFIIKPHSGKTHQIRVALSSIGSPIIGDPNYYPTSQADRGYLHAFGLQFTLNNTLYSYVNAPTAGMEFMKSSVIAQIDSLSKPWQLLWPSIVK
ncbi:MAG: tRNA pseudouridine32 synthase/23S rRNA pseudouridine746 synthase [Alteromonadaceae bacterium]|jgi:tRNA pseudouridine32 synthase/23S rRNA pseudouridine746 synthase